MFKRLKWIWLFLVGSLFLPSLALAETVHVSGYLRPLIVCAVVIIVAGFLLWIIDYWKEDIDKVSPKLRKVFNFVIVAVALVIIVIVLLGIVNINIT